MAGRMAIFKQQMKEKLGGSTSSKKSENAEVNAQLATTEALREHVKKTIKMLARDEKAIKHYADAGDELRDTLTKVSAELTELNVDMLASAVVDTSAFQKAADDAHANLAALIANECRSNLNLLTENELKDAKTQEAKFEKTRVALDAAIAEVKELKGNKKTKAETLAAAEGKLEQSQQIFDATGQDTQETLVDINLLIECMLIEKYCDFMDAYRDYFQTMSRYLNDIIPSLFNYKRFVQDSKEIRESVMLPAAQNANPQTAVFGQPLDVILARQGAVVPTIVQAAVDWLSEHALEEAGLFRISVAAPDLAQMKVWANATDNPDFSTATDPHLVAALLKTYFRDLPEPVLTYGLYQKLVDSNIIKEIPERVQSIRLTLEPLPDANYQTIRLLMWLLNCIIVYSDKNMMSSGNLATCWAPNLMAPETINPSNFDPFEPRAVIEFMIEHYNAIFPDDEAIEAAEVEEAALGATL